MIDTVLKGLWSLGFFAAIYLLFVPLFSPALGKTYITAAIAGIVVLSGITTALASGYEYAGRFARRLLRYVLFPLGVLALLGAVVGFLVKGNSTYLTNAGLIAILLAVIIVVLILFKEEFPIPGVDYY